jgi:hypothetical protein
VGRAAEAVAAELEAALAEQMPSLSWSTERYVGRTPVDVAGEGSSLLLVELEWRRADPSNNAVKLFRHLESGEISGPVRVAQIFTRYYDLASGGISSKRENAEFVGRRVAATFEDVTYEPLTLDIDPPKRGDDLPDGWREPVETAANRIVDRL